MKLPFWALGCEPSFDTTWKNLDCQTILEFCVGNHNFQVHRQKNVMHLRKAGEEYKRYDTITGEYTTILAEIVGFKALLTTRNGLRLETPPPAYYFLPFYIDQQKWTKAWDSFEKLTQYADWEKNLIKYHIGILTPEHLEYERKLLLHKTALQETITTLENLDKGSEVIKTYLGESNVSLDTEQMIEMTEEVAEELHELISIEETLLEEVSKIESEKAFLNQQEKITSRLIASLEEDYQFATEKLSGDFVECPLCRTQHQNSVINRASILVDKEQLKQQLEVIQNNLFSQNEANEKSREKLTEIRNKITVIQDKYISSRDIKYINSTSSLEEVIESLASNSMNKKLSKVYNKKSGEEKLQKKDLDELKKELKAFTKQDAERTERINSGFNSLLAFFINKLECRGINTANINNAFDHAKLVKEGGAAEGARGLLSYYLTIYSLIRENTGEAIAPLVIDTFNQQEQALPNYEKILETIQETVTDNSQIILGAMENDKLRAFKEKAYVINLDSRDKLLKKDLYTQILPEFTEIY